jgi:3-oxoadipate enol-lactonase
MPTIDADGCPIHVEVTGPDSAPALMLSNSLGTDLSMWDAQAEAFAKEFRLIRYDRRGHGKSGAPKGPYSMERLGRDVLAVLDALNIQKTSWCGCCARRASPPWSKAQWSAGSPRAFASDHRKPSPA